MKNYPKSHFIGQKDSIYKWILNRIDISYSTVLDLFGGSGLMSAAFRSMGKNLIYNDIMKCFQFINSGLLRSTKVDKINISSLNSLWDNSLKNQRSYAFEVYKDLYFFEDECVWIDKVITNIMQSNYSSNTKGILFFALYQTCLMKRPFNSFHRSFLNLRLKKRENYQIWDKSMEDIFIDSIHEVNNYLESIDVQTELIPIFGITASEAKPEIFNKERIDLLYLDPPFISGSKRSRKYGNYFMNYHVLESLANYESFTSWLDLNHLLKLPKQDHPLMKEIEKWLTKDLFLENLEKIISQFQESIIVFSY
ncbi:MAG: hypothetical protein HeimC3_52980 [Candidatus Heimdallarchaeota archaeon LC_3]|nr:MAG: hypothetical protein HeimC3_52980 [Candidatus Heimdallarchaeota archaeon LC_3]